MGYEKKIIKKVADMLLQPGIDEMKRVNVIISSVVENIVMSTQNWQTSNVPGIWQQSSVLKKQNVVTAHFKSEQLLPFWFYTAVIACDNLTVLQTVQRSRVYSATYDPLQYKEPVKSFEIRVEHSPGFKLPFVEIFPWLCRKRRKAIFTHIYISRD